MIAYVLLQVRPGLATFVMNSIVDAGFAARAATLTGENDVIARIEDVEFADLAARLDDVAAIAGIERLQTSIALAGEEVGLPWGLPITVPPRRDIVALVFVKLAPEGLAAVGEGLVRNRRVLAGAALSGVYDLLLEVDGKTPAEIGQTVVGAVRGVPGVISTSTSFILRATPLARKRARGDRPASS